MEIRYDESQEKLVRSLLENKDLVERYKLELKLSDGKDEL